MIFNFQCVLEQVSWQTDHHSPRGGLGLYRSAGKVSHFAVVKRHGQPRPQWTSESTPLKRTCHLQQ